MQARPEIKCEANDSSEKSTKTDGGCLAKTGSTFTRHSIIRFFLSEEVVLSEIENASEGSTAEEEPLGCT